MLSRALDDPSLFAIALDASPDALTEGAWRAHRLAVSNTAFLVESIERLPAELAGIADEATVHFPWGSLLRGLIRADAAVLEPLARLVRPGGELRVILSAAPRDGLGEITPATLLAVRHDYARIGLGLRAVREATAADVRETRSSWSKRLAVGRERVAVRARYRRVADVSSGGAGRNADPRRRCA